MMAAHTNTLTYYIYFVIITTKGAPAIGIMYHMYVLKYILTL